MSIASSSVRASALFALGLLVRVCFWLAASDWHLANSVAYEGDAPKWLSYIGDSAGSLLLALPFEPPGMIWLTNWLTDGDDFLLAKSVMVLLGAMLAPMIYLVVRRGFSERVALIAGSWCALSSGLVLLGSGLHSEIPYLVFFVVGLFALDGMRNRASNLSAVLFGASQAIACLVRVDHLAYVAFALAWLCWSARLSGAKVSLVATVAMLVVFAPWQWQASSMVARVNAEGFPGRAPAPLPIPNGLTWDDEAIEAVLAMPAFTHDMTFRFVQDVAKRQGKSSVAFDDLEILDDAYGCRPGLLSTPLLALYGPMNFCLGNYSGSRGGFSRSAFDHPPPLTGSVGQIVRRMGAIPPPNGPLRMDYPPHLEIINHGYRIGIQRILEDPAWAVSLIADKVLIAWSGVAGGFGSYAIPIGLSGVREPVDISVADGVMATVWRWILFVLAVVGLWMARSSSCAMPFLLFVAAKILVVALFFGYARFGALCIPSFAVLWSLALDGICSRMVPSKWWRRCLIGVLLLVLAAEVARCVRGSTGELVADGPTQGPILGRNERVRIEYR